MKLMILSIMSLLLTSPAFAKGLGYLYNNVELRLVANQYCVIYGTYEDDHTGESARAGFLTSDELCNSERIREMMSYIKNRKVEIFLFSTNDTLTDKMALDAIYKSTGIRNFENKMAVEIAIDITDSINKYIKSQN